MLQFKASELRTIDDDMYDSCLLLLYMLHLHHIFMLFVTLRQQRSNSDNLRIRQSHSPILFARYFIAIYDSFFISQSNSTRHAQHMHEMVEWREEKKKCENWEIVKIMRNEIYNWN